MAVTVLGHMKENKGGNPAQHLKNAIAYILNPEKTEDGLWIGSNCGTDTEEIYGSMIQTKDIFQKRWGRQGYHFVISFAPGEADAETVYHVGKSFCEKYLGENFEYCFAVHTDQKHLHCHIVFNSVSRDGYKYRYVDGDWEKKIQPITDEICREYHLPELTYDKQEKVGVSYAEHLAKKEGRFTNKDIIRADIDLAASQSVSMQDFFANMKKMGYQIRLGESEIHGRYAAYTMPGTEATKARRDYRLGSGYRLQDIQEKIHNKIKPQRIYYQARLPVIKAVSIYQRRLVLRIRQASEYQQFDLLEKDQARVRRDLLKINELERECNYILDHDIQSVEEIDIRLAEVNHEIAVLKNQRYSENQIFEALPEAERAILSEYREKKEMLQKEDLSDEDFEKISDDLEELEQLHGDVIFAGSAGRTGSNTRLQELRVEHRILLRLRREYEETMQIQEAARRKEIVEEPSQEKEKEIGK